MMGTPQFDIDKLKHDLAAKGWLPTDLARAADLSKATVSRVLSGERSNPRTIDRLARAMGYGVRRYQLPRVA